MKLVIEPSAGVGIAAWKKWKSINIDSKSTRTEIGSESEAEANSDIRNVVIILCGGNIDMELFYKSTAAQGNNVAASV
jgi:threonine dehydratase